MKQNLAYGYFVTRHGAFEYKNGWLRIPSCPFCGKEEKMGIHLRDNRTNCFVCGNHGNLYECIAEIEDITLSEVPHFVTQFDGMEYRAPKYVPPTPTPVILPDGYVNISRGETPIGRRARAYLIGRGFSIEYLRFKGIGYIEDEDSEVFNHIIIPFYNKGKLVYYQARRYAGVGPKYHNPATEDFGIPRGQIIYNVDALKVYKEINILEGAINVLTLGDSSIGLGGKVATTYQRGVLKRSKVSHYNILLDNDAWAEALNLVKRLWIPGLTFKVIMFEDERDPNDLGKAATEELIKNSPLLTGPQDIIKFSLDVKDKQRRLRKVF